MRHDGQVERWTTKDGNALTLRAIASSDVDIARAFTAALSFGTRYFRFGRGDFMPSEAELEQLCNPDPSRRIQLVVVTGSGASETMVASARCVYEPGRDDCEFATVVLDGWQGHGIGRRLMHQLMAEARARGLRTMRGQVLGSNVPMLAFMAALGFEIEAGFEQRPVRRVVRQLA